MLYPSKSEALRRTVRMWNWLADHPEMNKKQCPEAPTDVPQCWLCEHVDNQPGGYHPDGHRNCELCPLYSFWVKTHSPKEPLCTSAPCLSVGTPYKNWLYSDNRTRARNARRISKAAQVALDQLPLEDCGYAHPPDDCSRCVLYHRCTDPRKGQFLGRKD